MDQISYESIDETYAYGYYGDFKVILNTKDGYINGTKLAADGGKQFKNWIRLQHSKEMIESFTSFINPTHVSDANVVTVENTWLNRSAHIRAERSLNANFQLIYQVFDTNTESTSIVKGTYLHPDLIPHLVCWVCMEG